MRFLSQPPSAKLISRQYYPPYGISDDTATVVKKKEEWVLSHQVKELCNYSAAEVTASLKQKATKQMRFGCKNKEGKEGEETNG